MIRTFETDTAGRGVYWQTFNYKFDHIMDAETFQDVVNYARSISETEIVVHLNDES